MSITRSWVQNLSLPDERSNRETSRRIGLYSVYLVSLQGLSFIPLYYQRLFNKMTRRRNRSMTSKTLHGSLGSEYYLSHESRFSARWKSWINSIKPLAVPNLKRICKLLVLMEWQSWPDVLAEWCTFWKSSWVGHYNGAHVYYIVMSFPGAMFSGY